MVALQKDTMKLVEKAMSAFVKTWESNTNTQPIDQTIDDKGRPEIRNSNTAIEMIYNYIEERRAFLQSRDFKLLEIEKPFAVPLDEDRPNLIYVGRLDKVFQYQGRVHVIEHKTTTAYKKDGYFRSDFLDSFSPNSQVDGYLYSGHLVYGKKFKSVWIDAALVHGTVHDGFRFVPVERQLEQLAGWVWETLYWIKQIEANEQAATEVRYKNMPYLAAFPKNTTSCQNYGGCPYIDLCKMWANPEQEELPQGFLKYKWEPFNELDLRKSGLVKKTDSLYDNTRIQEYRNCFRKGYFRHQRHWMPPGDRRALLFGSSWHSTMDVVWAELARQ